MKRYVDYLKRLSIHTRQRCIEVVGLDINYQQVLVMKYVDKLSNDEIADKFSLSVERIETLITEARKRFDEIIENEQRVFNENQMEVIGILLYYFENDEEKVG